MKRKNSGKAFLRRSADEWEALGVRRNFAETFARIPVFGYQRLAALGALTGDELARLRRVADGSEAHPDVYRDMAIRMLACVPAS